MVNILYKRYPRTFIEPPSIEITAYLMNNKEGYIILGFKQKNIYTFESLYYGNATYIFGEKWEDLSKKTKAEILNQNLQTDRIIHREGWDSKIDKLFK